MNIHIVCVVFVYENILRASDNSMLGFSRGYLQKVLRYVFIDKGHLERDFVL